MVYRRKTSTGLSTRSQLLTELRNEQGESRSGSSLAQTIGVSRVAVWKGIQTLLEAGYPIETTDSGYKLDPQKDGDFLYPWEFGSREALFRHFENTGSTMDRARELAEGGLETGTVVIAEQQNAGRGRNGRRWVSGQGGLYFTLVDRPALAAADYILPALVMQIALARTLSAVCGKEARLRWPNDIYIGQKKIAGVMTEASAEGDIIRWLDIGVGINVNNPPFSQKSLGCAEILGRPVSRKEVLVRLLEEIDALKQHFSSSAAYSQGNRQLAAEWNALADGIGAKAALLDYGYGERSPLKAEGGAQCRVLCRGIYSGIDPGGRCIITTEAGAQALFFSPGAASLAFVSE